MRTFSWPEPLLRQLLLLSGLAGIGASRYFWPCVTIWLLLILHQYKSLVRVSGSAAKGLFLLCLILAFGSGCLYAHWRSPSTEHPLPDEAGADIWRLADNQEETPPGKTPQTALRLQGRVAAVQGRADHRLRLILEDLRVVSDNPLPEPAGRMVFTWWHSLTPEGDRKKTLPGNSLARRPVPGDLLEAVLRPREIRGLHNFGLWNVEEYWSKQRVNLRAWSDGILPDLHLLDTTGGRFLDLLREELRLKTLEALPRNEEGLRQGAALIPALIFGDQYLLNRNDLDLFARSTLAHSLALSGLHLGYAAALGYLAVRLIYRLRPSLAQRLPRSRAAILAGGLTALIYLWLGAAPPSLLRAFLMLCCLGIQLWRKQPHALADALIAALGIILLADPEAAFDLSLQLSALSLAAICLVLPFSGFLNSFLTPQSPQTSLRNTVLTVLRKAALLLLMSCAIQITLAPILVRSFGLLGLALPLNLLWLPVLGGAVLPLSFAGVLASALGIMPLAEICFHLAALPCEWLLQGLRWLENSSLLPAVVLPRLHWISMLAYWFLLTLIPALLSGRFSGGGRNLRVKLVHYQILCGLILLAAPPLWRIYDNNRDCVRLRLLDVGQGQSVLLEWQGGGRLLLDGGGGTPGFDPGKDIVAATLADNRLPRLDYMLASHLDADHAQGLLFPLRFLPVHYYADNGQIPDKAFSREIVRLLEAHGLSRHRLQAGESLALTQDLRLDILHPQEEFLTHGSAGPASNDNSLVARLVWRGQGIALICGDVEKGGQRELLKKNQSLGAEVIVLPHHGSAGAVLPEFYQAVAPKLALVSAGYANPWNFPSPLARNTLRNLGIPLLNTARCGQISLEWDSPQKAPKIRTARVWMSGYKP